MFCTIRSHLPHEHSCATCGMVEAAEEEVRQKHVLSAVVSDLQFVRNNGYLATCTETDHPQRQWLVSQCQTMSVTQTTTILIVFRRDTSSKNRLTLLIRTIVIQEEFYLVKLCNVSTTCQHTCFFIGYFTTVLAFFHPQFWIIWVSCNTLRTIITGWSRTPIDCTVRIRLDPGLNV